MTTELKQVTLNDNGRKIDSAEDMAQSYLVARM